METSITFFILSIQATIFFSSTHLSCWHFLPISFSCVFFILGDVNKTLGSFLLWFIKRVFFLVELKVLKRKETLYISIQLDSIQWSLMFFFSTLMSPKVFFFSMLCLFFFVWFTFVYCALKFIWISAAAVMFCFSKCKEKENKARKIYEVNY